MLGRKQIIPLRAIMLGIAALFGTSGVQAVTIDLDATGEGRAPKTYAKETLTAPPVKGGGYYKVTNAIAERAVIVQLDPGVYVNEEDLVVEVNLNGMVFSSDTPTLRVETGVACAETGGSGEVLGLRQGGQEGDKRAAFFGTVTTRSEGVSDSRLCMHMDSIGVSVSAPGGFSVTVKDTLAVLPSANMKANSNAIRVANALKETPAALMPTATVADGFLSFDGETAASVGSIWLGYESSYLDASTGESIEVIANDADGLTEAERVLTLEKLTGDIGADGGSSFVFSGDFSFAKEVKLSAGYGEDRGGGAAGSDCADGTNLLKTDNSTGEVTDTGELNPVLAMDIGMGKHLCIVVNDPEGEDAVQIPETDIYTVKTSYGGNDKLFPATGGMYDLGYIKRDGTTVRIGYLTTYADYNQRIVVRNRGGAAAYSLSFAVEEGATATPGADASGMLAANSVTYLSLKYGDVVSLEGTTRASATMTVVSEKRHIDVLVSQTNLNGGTDTVEYTRN